MQFNLEKSIGEWFPFFGSEIKADGEIDYLPPEKDAGRVCIRIADGQTMEAIHAQTRTRKAEFALNTKTRQMERVPYIDQTPEQEKIERELIWDHVIQDWEGLLDIAGKPIPCTLENKMKMMNIPVFARFVGRCLTLITGGAEEKKAALEKN